MNIEFTAQVFKEGQQYVVYAPDLDVSSCGGSESKARQNLLEAVRLFLEEAGKMGTLEQVLEESGYVGRKSAWLAPELVSTKRASLPLPLVHAKA